MARAQVDLATLPAKAARCRTELSTSCRSSIRLALENDAGLRIFNVARTESLRNRNWIDPMCSGVSCLRLAPALFVLIALAPKAASAQHSASTDSTNGAVIYALN